MIDVIYPMRNPDALTRGYGDCALLEEILNGKLWTPPQAYEFVHHDVRTDDEWPDVPGAVVLVNCRNNVDDADWLIDRIDRLGWALVILAGDEEWTFPWHRLPPTATRRTWIQAPTPEQAMWASHVFPGGWYWRTREEIEPHFARYMQRPLRWFFGGQVTHVRRKQCVSALRGVADGELIETDGFLRGVPTSQYHLILAGAKAIPSPSGPYTCDAARPLAAMEAGCVPILDLRKPLDPQFNYWDLVFGEDHPCPEIADWRDVGPVITRIDRDWQTLQPRVFSWWQQWKRDLACRLHHDIATLGAPRPPAMPDDRITVVVTTSPIPSHPSTTVIDETIASIRESLPTAQIVVAVDGVRPEQVYAKDRYFWYIERLLWKCNFEWHNVVPVVLDEWGHQANLTRRALDFVDTETILFVEHDTPVCGDIPWANLIEAIHTGAANAIRLHQDVEIHPDHEAILLDDQPWEVAGVPMRRSSAWWQRPHLASTEFYRRFLDDYFPTTSRTMIEDRLYSPVHLDSLDGNWGRWKVWVYTPKGNMQRSRHLDGRQDQPKFEMRYE